MLNNRWLSVLLLSGLAACQAEVSQVNTGNKKRDTDKPVANRPPTAPVVDLQVVEEGRTARLYAVMVSESTDPDGDSIGYSYAWYRDGEPVDYPAGQTEAVAEIPPRTGVHFDDEVVRQSWKVAITAKDPYNHAVTASAMRDLTLVNACDPFPHDVSPEHLGESPEEWALVFFVDCKGENEFTVHRDEPLPSLGDGLYLELENSVHTHMLGEEPAFKHFVDGVIRRVTHAGVNDIAFNGETYRYEGGYVPFPLLDKICLDIPLVGPVCLNAFALSTEANDGRIFDTGPNVLERRSIKWWERKAGSFSLQALPEDSDTYDLSLDLGTSVLDIIFEPPIDPTVRDVWSNQAGYSPQNDLSTYLKAVGSLVTKFLVNMVITVSEDRKTVGFALRTIVVGNEFYVPLESGPYCNHNLGTVGSWGLPSFSPRPFDDTGSPMYPGLISDTVGGMQVLRDYYAKNTFPYPHLEPSPSGGSGAGRDGLSAFTSPYAYDSAKGLWSDNPNNCRLPADACDVEGIQDGGPEFGGVSANCEYPNVSDDGDDATYRTSEQLTSIIPYITGEFRADLPSWGKRAAESRAGK